MTLPEGVTHSSRNDISLRIFSFSGRRSALMSKLESSRVRLSVREFFDPYICSIEKKNWLNHNYQCRSCHCACIFDKFFFTKPRIPLQSVQIRKGFGAKKIKNFSFPLMTVRIPFSIMG